MTMTTMRKAFLKASVAKSTQAGNYDKLPPSIRKAVAQHNIAATLRSMKLGPKAVAALARQNKAPTVL
jgi:hypothetical protein